MNNTFYIFSDFPNEHIRLLDNACKARNIHSEILLLSTPPLITIERDIHINNKSISNSSIYIHNIFPDYLALPVAKSSCDYTLFQDYHISREQNNSLFLSLFEIASKKNDVKIYNNPYSVFDKFSTVYMLEKLKEDINVLEYILCNNYTDLKSTELFADNQSFFWSYPYINSPIKFITKKKISQLFESEQNIPFLIMPSINAKEIKLFFFKNNPILGLLITSPVYNSSTASLEKFEFIMPDNRFSELGKIVAQYNISDFYSINALLTEDGNLYIYSYNPDPNISVFNEQINTYLAEYLINFIFPDSFLSPAIPKDNARNTVFLSSMLEPLFAIDKINSGR